MDHPVRILLVEDVPTDAELAVRELRRAALRVESRVADQETTFRQALAEFAPDVILSDFSMPTFDGMSALALARELSPETPFIFVSGTIGEEYAIRALKNGATDYVLKSNLMRLPAAVERAVQERAERAALRKQASRIERLSRMRDFTSGINLALVRMRDLDDLAEDVCRIAVRDGGFVGAHLSMLDLVSGDVLVRGCHGTGEISRAAGAVLASVREDDTGGGIIGRSLRRAAPELWNDVRSDPGVRHRERFLASGVGAVGSFPLLVEDRPVGVLGLHAADAGFFDHEEVRLLRELTANISFALELQEKRQRLNYLAYYDPLTDLPNRALLHDRLAQAVENARGGSRGLALMLFDIERFKSINDTQGMHVGDQLLKQLAGRLRGSVEDGRLARVGGDEFAVMFLDNGDPAAVARRLESAEHGFFGAPFVVDGGQPLYVSAKGGIAVYPEDGDTADTLYGNAEAALKRAKTTGERYVFYAPHINARVAQQVDFETRLRGAVERGEFLLYYQPKVALDTRRIVGAEALLRWKPLDSERMVPPGEFIPLLEVTGLIESVGRWAIAEAVGVHRGWRARGFEDPPRIAVNVSALQLRGQTFVAEVAAAVGGAHGDESAGLDLEITESLLMQDMDESIRKLRDLRGMGVRISLDDFGTGYSSLAYLSQLPIDTLKIDRAFVSGMLQNAGDTSIVNAIVSLARALRLQVVAEGVEEEAQAQLLRALGCDQMQGYLYSRPLPQAEFEALAFGTAGQT